MERVRIIVFYLFRTHNSIVNKNKKTNIENSNSVADKITYDNPWEKVVSMIDLKDKGKERMKEVILAKKGDYSKIVKK